MEIETMNRRPYIFLFVLTVSLFSFSSPLIAGGVTNNQTFSAEYIRTFSRNAAINSSDAVAYNPAGVMRLEDGNYINFFISHVLKDYSNTIAGTDYESTIPSDVPGLIALHKKDNWAAFFAFTIPAGGGAVDFKDGNATTLSIGESLFAYGYNSIDSQQIKANSFYYGYTLGGAYQLNEKVSISLGARYIDATKGADGSVTVSISGTNPSTKVEKYTDTARGLGWIAGAHIKASDKMEVGLRYETATPLKFKRAVERDDLNMYTDGSEEIQDLPGLIGLGVSYQLSPDISLMGSLTQYREADANLESSDFDGIGNGYEAALSIEKRFDRKLKGSIGYMHTETNLPADKMSKENPPLSAETICGGLAYLYSPKTVLNFGISKSIYSRETTSDTSSAYDPVELDKKVITLALGVEHKF